MESPTKERKFWVRPIFRDQRRRAQGATHTRLHICIRYLASGDSMESIAYQFRVSHNTVSKIIRETCRAIWISLKRTAFPRLTRAGWLSHAKGFEEKWNFPHCIGAIDGKLVSMQAPPNSGSEYYSYKGRFSMNLMAISDAYYRFIAVDIGAPGRRSDGGVFAESEMFRKFETNTFEIPNPEAIMTNTPHLPYVLVADEAFTLTKYCMRPYPRSKALNIKKKIFNYRLSRARRMVESAFGIFAARWRIFRKDIIGSTKLVRNIIQATTCLHNWIITESLNNPENKCQYTHLSRVDRQSVNALQNIPRQNANQPLHNTDAQTVRNNFAEYFMSPEGELPWQYDKVLQNNF
ncbi:uncharacterized protein LOC122510608 [Leptopilina heterotoma]|uniref:uncharacterized protein LOC122506769 n=1 Tax=Leptopilina heterotoma TaxID=63436 RepID=UPI001CA940E8|nr:uncharacterized protein LOC122506769 [Leptopilina heterotoma]XP_043481314.1 uncharacterized protein LOC122510608 [Leptopilina heterotoma]